MNQFGPPYLLFSFIKFTVLFLVIYYPLLWLSSTLLEFNFSNSLEIFGSKSSIVSIYYLVAIQITGIGFGFIGYGSAAINREYGTSQMTHNIFKFLQRGPFQRGIPSRESAGILFLMFFILGSIPMSFAVGLVLDIPGEMLARWAENIGVGAGLLVLCIPAFVSSIASAAFLLPPMRGNEYRSMQ